MSGCRVVLWPCPISSLRLYFETSTNLSLQLRMSPFLSASDTMLVRFMISVRTFSSVSTSSSRTHLRQRGFGVDARRPAAARRFAERGAGLFSAAGLLGGLADAAVLGLLQFGAGQQAGDPGGAGWVMLSVLRTGVVRGGWAAGGGALPGAPGGAEASWLSDAASKISATSPLPRIDEPDMPRRLRNSRPSGLMTVWCWPSSWSTHAVALAAGLHHHHAAALGRSASSAYSWRRLTTGSTWPRSSTTLRGRGVQAVDGRPVLDHLDHRVQREDEASSCPRRPGSRR
jgi:hypothetical protein